MTLQLWRLELGKGGGEDNWGQSWGHVGAEEGVTLGVPATHLGTALPLCRRALIEISC